MILCCVLEWKRKVASVDLLKEYIQSTVSYMEYMSKHSLDGDNDWQTLKESCCIFQANLWLYHWLTGYESD